MSATHKHTPLSHMHIFVSVILGELPKPKVKEVDQCDIFTTTSISNTTLRDADLTSVCFMTHKTAATICINRQMLSSDSDEFQI